MPAGADPERNFAASAVSDSAGRPIDIAAALLAPGALVVVLVLAQVVVESSAVSKMMDQHLARPQVHRPR